MSDRALAKRGLGTAARDAAVVLRGTRPSGGLAPSSWYEVDQRTLSLAFRPDTPYEVWEAETAALLEVAVGIPWMVGDALAFGELAYGEVYAQVLDSGRYAWDTVGRLARTSLAIPPGRRRPQLSHSVHSAVEGLPIPEQEALLDEAERHGLTREQVRALARGVRRQLDREAAARLPVPQLALDGLVLGVSDARSLPIPDQSVDLIVTSPPYGLDVAYGVGDVRADAWPGFMLAWLVEALRVAKPHGRLALNVPLDASEPWSRPTYAQATAAALAAGWEYAHTIVWHDGTTTKGNRALGSVNSAARPHHVSAVEMIGVFSHGEWAPSSVGSDDITGEEWQRDGRGPWEIPGESRAWEGRPAAFPVELPRRLVRYLSRVGDVVCDPFCGSGTTLVAGYELARRTWGFDLDPEAVASSTRRLAVIGGQGRGRSDGGDRPTG